MLPRRSILLSHAPHSTSCHRLPLFTSPTIPTPSIFPRKALSENASRLRNFRKYYTKVHFACGTSANAMQFAFRFIPSYSGVFLMGFNGFSGGDSCGGKGKTQCRLSASLALFRMVLSGPKSVSSTFAEMKMWRGACKKPTCGLPSGVLFLFSVDGLRDERL